MKYHDEVAGTQRYSLSGFAALSLLFLLLSPAGCGFGGGDVSCNPPPQISTYPPIDATVGQPTFMTLTQAIFAACGTSATA